MIVPTATATTPRPTALSVLPDLHFLNESPLVLHDMAIRNRFWLLEFSDFIILTLLPVFPE